MGRAGGCDETGQLSEEARFQAAQELADRVEVGEEFEALMRLCTERELKLSIVPFTDGRIYINVNPLDGTPEGIADESESVFVMHDPYPPAEAFRIAREGAVESLREADEWAGEID
jgi:hypothetical protein